MIADEGCVVSDARLGNASERPKERGPQIHSIAPVADMFGLPELPRRDTWTIALLVTHRMDDCLRCAIQTLQSEQRSPAAHVDPPIQQHDRDHNVLRALSCFLELALDLNAAHRAAALVALQSRAIPSLCRWFSSSGVVDAGLSHPAVHASTACLMYCLCRDAAMAPWIVQSGAHHVLLQLGGQHASASSQSSTRVEYGASARLPSACECDAQDVLLGIDAFDYMARPIVRLLEHDPRRLAVFRLPIGPRSLGLYVLQHRAIPTCEADEFDALGMSTATTTLRSDSRIASAMRPRSHSRSRSRRAPPRKLPSIFAFARTNINSDAWRVLEARETTRHFVVRALTALAWHLHIPNDADQDDRYAPERKILVGDGALDLLRHLGDGRNSIAVKPTLEISPIDSIEADVVRAIARAGAMTLTQTSPSKPQATLALNSKLMIASASKTSSLAARLQIVSSERQQLEQSAHAVQAAHDRASDRRALRDRLHELCDNAEAARALVLQGLHVLASGREHAIDTPLPSMVEWLEGFETLESKAKAQRQQQEQRERARLVQQYERELLEHRRQLERARMQQNDVNVLDRDQYTLEIAQRAAFEEMQLDMAALQREAATNIGIQNDHTNFAGSHAEVRFSGIDSAQDRHRQEQERRFMSTHDLAFAERIRRAQREAQIKAKRDADAAKDPLQLEREHITRIRREAAERQLQQRELENLQEEDRWAHHMRYLEREAAIRQRTNESREQQLMTREDQETRVRWRAVDEAMRCQELERQRLQRANERKQRRWQKQQAKQDSAWVSCYDEQGRLYYYNSLTQVSQWERPQ